LVVVALQAWFPLRSHVTRVARTAPVISADGVVTFEGSSVLVGEPGPAWVDDAATSGQLAVRLAFRAADDDQRGPARMLTVTEDVRHADLMIGQDGRDVVVRVLRPGSDTGGDPPYRIAAAVEAGTWQVLDVRLGGGRIEASLDGRPVLDEPLGGPPGVSPLAGWDRGYRVALGDEPLGDREWAGQLREATVTAPQHRVDLLAAGALRAGTGEVLHVHTREILRPPDDSPLFVGLRMLIFAPVGLALGLRLRRPLVAAILAAAVPTVLALGKLFVAGRHPGLVEVVVGAAGALIGVGVGVSVQRTREAPRRGDASDQARPKSSSRRTMSSSPK
jgi:hypothetical protein